MERKEKRGERKRRRQRASYILRTRLSLPANALEITHDNDDEFSGTDDN